jgi:CheY-like chemotaxis protein
MKKNQFRLYLLEDDDNDAFMIQRALEQTCPHCEVTHFHDPTQAIETLEKLVKPDEEAPNLILTDLKMPRMNGLEFVQWLRASRFSCIPTIMLSGSSLPVDILAAYRHGMNSFSTKPLNVTDLNEIVSTVMRYWRETCQTPATVLQGGMHLCGKEEC